MAIIVDEQLCAGTGVCEMVCPEVFEVADGIAIVDQEAVEEHSDKVIEAVTLCPNSALSTSDWGTA